MTLRTITFDDEQWQVVPREAFDRAMRNTWNMIDPVRPVGDTGSYWRGQENGIAAALRTLRENYEAELSRAAPEPPAQQPINQCDGCRRGLPVDEHGTHRGKGYDMIDCTAHLYQPPAQQPMLPERILDLAERLGWVTRLGGVGKDAIALIRAYEAALGIGKGESNAG